MNNQPAHPDPSSQHTNQKLDFIIFVHVFYPEIWEEMRCEIAATVRQPFGLVLTRPPCVRLLSLPNTPWLRFSQQIVVENRGRDILPFLKGLRTLDLPDADIGLKLHTKRSPHRADGSDWRKFLSASLLQCDEQNGLLGYSLLKTEPRIGLIAPEAHLLPLNGRTSINDTMMSDVLACLYGRDSSGGVVMDRFAAGSMFWFRRSAFDPLLAPDIDSLFAAERGQLDGTAAHAMERLFATIIEQHGHIAVGMENAIPILNAPPEALTATELHILIDTTLNRDNPFSMALADFWRNNPRLLKLAHAVYARMPNRAIRLLRAALRRG